MTEDEIRELVSRSGCPVAAAVMEIHEPTYPPPGATWLSGGNGPRCEHTGDPFEDPLWPCTTVEAVVTALARHEGGTHG